MEVGSERNGLSAAVKYDPANEAFARRLRQCSEPPEVPGSYGMAGFDFDTHEVARCLLEHDIHFFSRVGSKVKHDGSSGTPPTLLA